MKRDAAHEVERDVEARLKRGLHGALIAKTVRSYGEDPQTLAPRLGVEEKLWQN